MTDLKTTFAGLQLKNPIIISTKSWPKPVPEPLY